MTLHTYEVSTKTKLANGKVHEVRIGEYDALGIARVWANKELEDLANMRVMLGSDFEDNTVVIISQVTKTLCKVLSLGDL